MTEPTLMTLDHARETITVVPKHWITRPYRSFGQLSFFFDCYGANPYEWVAANCQPGDRVEYRQYNRDITHQFGPWTRATFLRSYMYDGIIANVKVDARLVSLFLDMGDEMRRVP